MSFQPRPTPQDIAGTVSALIKAGITMPPSVIDAMAKIDALAKINQEPPDLNLRTATIDEILTHTQRVALISSPPVKESVVSTASVLLSRLAIDVISADVAANLDGLIDQLRPDFEAVTQVGQLLPRHVADLERVARLRILLSRVVHEFGDVRYGQPPNYGELFTDDGAAWTLPGESAGDRWLRYALTSRLRLQTASEVASHRQRTLRNLASDYSASVVADWGDDDAA